MKTNESPDTVEACIQRCLHQTEDYVRREPLVAMTAAFGAGVLCKLLPARTLATLAVKLMPSVLLGVGVLKVMELCSQHCQPPADRPLHLDSP